ncbi:MAG: hypothetical protein ABIF77_04380 [bacterium]
MTLYDKRHLALSCLLLLTFMMIVGCTLKVQHRTLVEPVDYRSLASLDSRSPVLKAHLSDGGLYILNNWTVDEETRTVHGTGALLDARRDTVTSGPLDVAVDSVAIFESNVLQNSQALAPLTVLTVASAALSVYCLTNPKACFGSCPTFYVPADSGAILQAEGFSASVAPALEANDLDLLLRCRPRGRTLPVTMTNEALETHVVRRVELLALKRPAGGRVLADHAGRFWQTGPLQPLQRCLGAEGDCTTLLTEFDGRERFSLADDTDLATREFLEVEFATPPPGVRQGLVIVSRQSLLSTYLFYQGLAYLGGHAAPALVRAEQVLEPVPGQRSLGSTLGNIEVQIRNEAGLWRTVGAAGETGPLATNCHFVPLDLSPSVMPPGAPLQLRLRLTRGHWRLDQLALATILGETQPRRIPPSRVQRDDTVDETALAILLDPERCLTTLPGDRYELVYDLPACPQQYEYCLDSQGYYLEWMREEWRAEEDPVQAALLFLQPELALRQLASAFKALEPSLETEFWGSRYAR